jgi:hypothetical protein
VLGQSFVYGWCADVEAKGCLGAAFEEDSALSLGEVARRHESSPCLILVVAIERQEALAYLTDIRRAITVARHSRSTNPSLRFGA